VSLLEHFTLLEKITMQRLQGQTSTPKQIKLFNQSAASTLRTWGEGINSLNLGRDGLNDNDDNDD